MAAVDGGRHGSSCFCMVDVFCVTNVLIPT
jgi:hypothetical protein